jgi:hypothetical protein
MPLSTADIEAFRERGYVIARNVFSADEVSKFREGLANVREAAISADAYDINPDAPEMVAPHGDLLSMHELRAADYIILDERIVECARRLLGAGNEKIVYHGDSSIQLGEGPRGFHKDNADRGDPTGNDWVGFYGIVRMGIYLQDHSSHSGGLKVRDRSHRRVSHHRGWGINLATRSGDVVFWYLTTTHSGNFVRTRVFSNVCLHPRLERLVPQALRVPEPEERRSVFCSYGAAGEHLDHYIDYQRKREDVALHWRRCGVGQLVETLAANRGVELRRPSPDYGAQRRGA